MDSMCKNVELKIVQHKDEWLTNLVSGYKVTLAHAVYEASDHEDRVKVPQLLRVCVDSFAPGKGNALSIPAILQHPVQGQSHQAMQEGLGKEGKETQAAARTSRHLLVIFY